MKFSLRSMIGLIALSIGIPSVACAHPIDVAYMDFSSSSGTLVLTVAVHPAQAFELLRKPKDIAFDLVRLREGGEIISSYMQDHVELMRGTSSCTWRAGTTHVPETELDAVADGITVDGPVDCGDANATTMSVTSTIFIDRFPLQTTILRLEYPEGFAERGTLDRTTRGGELDLSPILFPATSTPSDVAKPNTISDLARRAVDPSIGWFGILALLGSAVVIGALHALGPGHGKSLMAAVLVGEKATIKKALTLGGVMAITHVSDVLILAFVSIGVTTIFPPSDLFRYLEISSAVALLVFGFIQFARSLGRYVSLSSSHATDHDHGPHAHTHDHTTFRRALWMGFFGSLAPCPSAWAMFLAMLALGRPMLGLVLLIAFTIGLTATILTIGMLIVMSKKFAERKTPERVVYALPVISSILITILGGWLLLKLLV